MKKLLTNWAFIIASCIMVVSAFTDCAPFTTGVLTDAKQPRNNYQVTSIDSAFYTNQNEVIVYYKAANKRRVFDYKVVLDFGDSSYLKHKFFAHYSTWKFPNKAFRSEPNGTIIGEFELLQRNDSINYYYEQMREEAGVPADDSFAVLQVVTGHKGLPGTISPIYVSNKGEYSYNIWTSLPVKRRFRKTENYLLLPIAAIPDVVINAGIVVGAVIAIPVVIYKSLTHPKRKMKKETQELPPPPPPDSIPTSPIPPPSSPSE